MKNFVVLHSEITEHEYTVRAKTAGAAQAIITKMLGIVGAKGSKSCIKVEGQLQKMCTAASTRDEFEVRLCTYAEEE